MVSGMRPSAAKLAFFSQSLSVSPPFATGVFFSNAVEVAAAAPIQTGLIDTSQAAARRIATASEELFCARARHVAIQADSGITAKAIENVEPRTCQAATPKATTSSAATRLS